jgi:hypothetical protein
MRIPHHLIEYAGNLYVVYGMGQFHVVIPSFLEITDDTVVNPESGESCSFVPEYDEESDVSDFSGFANFIVDQCDEAGHPLIVIPSQGLFPWSKDRFDSMIAAGEPPFMVVNRPDDD